MLSTEQSKGYDWFVSRFGVMSSSGTPRMMLDEKSFYSNQQKELLTRIGHKLKTSSDDDEILQYQNLLIKLLKNLKIARLNEILRAYGQPLSDVKDKLVENVQKGPKGIRDEKTKQREQILTSMVLKPVKNEAMKIGYNNKDKVPAFCRSIHNFDASVRCIKGPMTFGLCVRDDAGWIGLSVDGFVKLSISSNIYLYI